MSLCSSMSSVTSPLYALSSLSSRSPSSSSCRRLPRHSFFPCKDFFPKETSKKVPLKLKMGQTVSRITETETETETEKQNNSVGVTVPNFAVPLPLTGPNAAPYFVRKAVAEQPWKGALEPCGEHSYTVNNVDIDGKIPEDICGTSYRCGPGRIRVGENKYNHWFDGCGMVYGLEIDGSDGKVKFTCKWVQTPRFQKQEKEGNSTLIVKGAWTLPQTIFSRIGLPQNPSNTSIIFYDNKLLSLCEGGAPMEVDSKTLTTKGKCDFGLKCFFSAHPKIDPVTGVLYNQGFASSSDGSFTVNVFSISPDGSVRTAPKPIVLSRTSFVHDSAISQNYFVLTISPYVADQFDMLLSVLGVKSIGDSFHYEPNLGTRVIIVSKETLSVVKDMTMDAFSSYHFCNAYEESGKLHVLVNVLDGPRESLESQFADMYASNWTRKNYNTIHDIVFDIATWKLLGNSPAIKPTLDSDPLYGMEFPQINANFVGRKNRFTYVLGTRTKEEDEAWAAMKRERGSGGGEGESERRGEDGEIYGPFLNCLQKYDHVTGRVETFQLPGQYPAESDFIPRAGAVEEDDGYLLTFFYEPKRHATNVVIIDAKNFNGPPLATIKLPTHVPYYFHGCWVPSS